MMDLDFDLNCVDRVVDLKAVGDLVAVAVPGFDLMHVEEVVVGHLARDLEHAEEMEGYLGLEHAGEVAVGHLATHFDERLEVVEVVEAVGVALKVRVL
jgi:hypothetical protein